MTQCRHHVISITGVPSVQKDGASTWSHDLYLIECPTIDRKLVFRIKTLAGPLPVCHLQDQAVLNFLAAKGKNSVGTTLLHLQRHCVTLVYMFRKLALVLGAPIPLLYLVYTCLHTIEFQTIEGKMASSVQDVGSFIGVWNLQDPSHMEVLLKDR